jgi:DNA-binding MarR family transcriptional regulator
MVNDAFQTLLALAAANATAGRSLEAQGLSFSELRLLLAVRKAEGGARRPTDLARELALTPSGITRALLPLEKRGIVVRQPDERDGRASQTALTEAGNRLLDEALAIAAERSTKLLRRLSIGQTKQLQRLLEEVGR